MSLEHRADIIEVLQTLASERSGALLPSAASWFDGFWDFFTAHRSVLERSPGVAGAAPRPWLVLCRETEGRPAIEIFVESRDSRPGAVAPAPVSSIYLQDGSAVPRRALPPRAIDPVAARELSALGFSVDCGHWGPRVTLAEVGSPLDAGLLLCALDAACRIAAQATLQR